MTLSDWSDADISEDSQTLVTVRTNGPLIVKGSFLFDDGSGNVELKSNISICRCGHSKSMPYCDATHNRIHFSE